MDNLFHMDDSLMNEHDMRLRNNLQSIANATGISSLREVLVSLNNIRDIKRDRELNEMEHKVLNYLNNLFHLD